GAVGLELGRKLGDVVRGGGAGLAGEDEGGVAGGQVDQEEVADDDGEDDGDGQEEPPQDVLEPRPCPGHRSSGVGRGGRSNGATASSTPGRTGRRPRAGW